MMKIVVVPIQIEQLAKMIVSDGVFSFDLRGIPSDAEISHAWYDQETRRFMLCLRHDSFEEVYPTEWYHREHLTIIEHHGIKGACNETTDDQS